MLVLIVIACAELLVMLAYFVMASKRLSKRTDPLKDAIHRCNEHCRIKAEYDCHG